MRPIVTGDIFQLDRVFGIASGAIPACAVRDMLQDVEISHLTQATSLRIGDVVVSRAEDGPLDTEYALFDPGEVVLGGVDRLDIREVGYLTTVGDARTRLAKLGITAELASSASSALSDELLANLMRADELARIASSLGPSEIFDGGTYSHAQRSYEGAFLDLRALAKATGLRDVPASIQALFLASILADIDADVPVHLSTASLSQDGPANKRTYHRPSLGTARRLPAAFAEVQASTKCTRTRDRSYADRLRRSMRDRAGLACDVRARERLDAIASALATAPVQRPSDGYVRAKTALERGDERLEKIAEMLSGLSSSEPMFFEVTLLAARAWFASGDLERAKEYAKRLVDDANVPDGLRLAALDIVEAEERQSSLPRVVSVRELPGASRPPYASVEAEPVTIPRPVPMPMIEGVIEEAPRTDPRPLVSVEIVESMLLPTGLSEDMLSAGETPRTPDQARIAMTRIARALARDYRVSYGTTLKTDVMSIETIQRHLRRRFPVGNEKDEKVTLELQRHGAFLSEVIARRLGGKWTDVSVSEVGYWTMTVPPGTRIWPIGRVFRFFAMGNKERDLVGYFTELEAQVKRKT